MADQRGQLMTQFNAGATIRATDHSHFLTLKFANKVAGD
jgi:hypothetical protein